MAREQGSRSSEQGVHASSGLRRNETPLFRPEKRNVAFDQMREGKGLWLAPFENRLLQIRRKKGEPQDTPCPDHVGSRVKNRSA